MEFCYDQQDRYGKGLKSGTFLDYIFTQTKRTSRRMQDKEANPIIKARQCAIEEELLSRIKAYIDPK